MGRFLVESLRIDTANKILGLRVNTWTSLIVFVSVALFLVVGGLRRRPGDNDEPYRDGHRFEPTSSPAASDLSDDSDDSVDESVGEEGS